MTFLSWTLVVLIILCLALLLYFLFFTLLPSIKSEETEGMDPVFSDVEVNYVIPKDDEYEGSDKRAFVMCSSEKDFSEFFKFNPGESCLVANEVFHSGTRCVFSCLGLGDCVKTCPQEAIFIKNHTAVVSDLCIGCGICVKSCPKNIIKMVDKDSNKELVCSNTDSELAGCSHNKKEENIQRDEKKDFKIWKQCYKLKKHIKF